MTYTNDPNYDIHKDSHESIIDARKQLLHRSMNWLEQVIAPQTEALPVEHIQHTMTGQFDHIKEEAPVFIAPTSVEPTPPVTEYAQFAPTGDAINLDAVRQQAVDNANDVSFTQLLTEAQDMENRRAA